MAETEEIPLAGGRATFGVVRLGETVRRPKSANSEFVRALLGQLEAADGGIAPRHLGFDERGREMLSYVAGDTFPRWRDYSSEQVTAAARLLRRFHDATRGSPLAGGQEVVCHFDPGPNNAIFRDDLPCAWIDFDFAAPGVALDDVAYLAWSWCISSSPARLPVDAQAALVAAVADAYGLDAIRQGGLVDAILGRLIANIDYWDGHVRRPGNVPATLEGARTMRAWSQAEFAHVRAQRSLFESALGVS